MFGGDIKWSQGLRKKINICICLQSCEHLWQLEIEWEGKKIEREGKRKMKKYVNGEKIKKTKRLFDNKLIGYGDFAIQLYE